MCSLAFFSELTISSSWPSASSWTRLEKWPSLVSSSIALPPGNRPKSFMSRVTDGLEPATFS
jgi:hypothetical protein